MLGTGGMAVSSHMIASNTEGSSKASKQSNLEIVSLGTMKTDDSEVTSEDFEDEFVRPTSGMLSPGSMKSDTG